MGIKYYQYAAMNEWYMVYEDGKGKGFRFQTDLSYNCNQFFTFDITEHDFIKLGVEGEEITLIGRLEYLTALSLYLKWVQTALVGVNLELNKIAA